MQLLKIGVVQWKITGFVHGKHCVSVSKQLSRISVIKVMSFFPTVLFKKDVLIVDYVGSSSYSRGPVMEFQSSFHKWIS